MTEKQSFPAELVVGLVMLALLLTLAIADNVVLLHG